MLRLYPGACFEKSGSIEKNKRTDYFVSSIEFELIDSTFQHRGRKGERGRCSEMERRDGESITSGMSPPHTHTHTHTHTNTSEKEEQDVDVADDVI